MTLRTFGLLALAVCGSICPLPAEAQAAVLHLAFDGTLRDGTGQGHDAQAEAPEYAAGQKGQALKIGQAPALVPDAPELRLAAGLRIECWVMLGAVPAAGQQILVKGDEYMLRVDPAGEGGHLAFFVGLGGWEPRVRSTVQAQAGVWYHILAAWDGRALTLDVNGEKARSVRSGVPRPTKNPLVLSAPGGLMDEIRIENPRLPVLRLRDLAQEHAILGAGRPEKLTATVQNLGTEAANATAVLELPAGVTCPGGTTQELGVLATGAAKSVEWTVRADAGVSVTAGVRLTAAGCAPVIERPILSFFPPQDQPALSASIAPPAAGAVTYYVDSAAGRNTNSGTSPEAPWQDFTNMNGKTLAAGERLLIKRGSVINQELTLSARGTAENWAEIGAYGNGARPIIRRNWDIGDRCVLVRNPDYLRIRSLVVCHAAKGLMVFYEKEGHAGLAIEDCIAHHIEGLYRPNSHGIPEWRDRAGPEGDGWNMSAGIGIGGARPRDILVRNCEMFQCSWGFVVSGEAVTVDRVFCHDNYVHNTSPHPAMVTVRRSYLQNSIFDAPGWHAFAGTMGIMLVNPQGLIIRNCTFRNQPDSGSHDEGCIDFENSGSGCLIEQCTFENNAGAAIEVLGLSAPQPRNLEIANSRFIKNNTALKLGPAEVYVWGKSANPEVCCSTGSIHGNGYVTNPGVQFHVNEAPTTTRWTLRDNTGYATVEALEKAMPFNRAPAVNAGPDVRTDSRSVRLKGSVTDDGKPGVTPLAVRWEVLEGPGPVVFGKENTPETRAEFSVPGDYLLRLVGDDGELWRSDMASVHILPAGASVAVAWEFNKPLDKEGWTEGNPGTREQEWKHPQWPSKSQPVKYSAGGFYVLAIEASPDAHLLSPDRLGVGLDRNKAIKIRFQNHTPATRMRFRFTTDADAAWDDARSRGFEVTPTDSAPREYTVDMSGVPGWRGRLKQLRLDLATGEPLTGTCRVDYVWVGRW